MSFTEDYKSQFQALLESLAIAESSDALLFNFSQRWLRLHVQVVEQYDKEKASENYIDENTSQLLKSRERIISGFLQTPRALIDTALLAQFVRQHDEILRNILQRALSKIKAELVKAHATKKALSGYAETMSGRGIR